MHVPLSSRPFTSRRLAVAAVAVLALAACGDDDDADAEPAATTVAAQAPADTAAATAAPAATTAPAEEASDRAGYGTDTEAPATAAPTASGEAAVQLVDSDLGQIVAAADGMTMYLFMPDNAGDPTCADACAEAWPPLFVEDGAEVVGGTGVDAALLGTATHPTGGTQVTYGGWPLYYFAGDSAPGDTNGQGQGDVWYVVDAAGQPVP